MRLMTRQESALKKGDIKKLFYGLCRKMTRYATAEEKITCKNCTVEFTEREIADGMCPM